MSAPNSFASATDMAEAIRSRRVSSRELVEACFARIDHVNPGLNAIVFVDRAGALERAAACDAALARGETWGPFHGVPVTIKDSFDVVGMPTTWGKPELRDNISAKDAVPVARLRRAGAVVLGKTNVPYLVADHQTFNDLYGITKNPWNLGRTPGGSSGGAAAALAAGLTGLDIGSDIGGSIRQPAHCCGIYGHKPSFGVCAVTGHNLPGELGSLDMLVVGPLARSAADLEAGLGILTGADPPDSAAWALTLPEPRWQSPAVLRIGVMLDDAAAPVDVEVRDVIARLIEFLGPRVAEVQETQPIADTRAAFSLYVRLLRAATTPHLPDADYRDAVAHAAALAPDDVGYLADTQRGRALSHRDWLIANEVRLHLAREWERFFVDFDLLLCPPACTAAPLRDETTERHARMNIVNGKGQPATNDLFWAGLAGMVFLPATVVPAGQSAAGLPIGVQIVGPKYADLSCIRFAAFLEREYVAFTPPPGYA